jgi:protein TonB
MGNRSLFLFSAFIALASYVLLILVFILYIHDNKTKKFKNVTRETILEVNIISQKKSDTHEKLKSSAVKKNEKTIVKKSTSNSAKKTTNLKSLFANVSTKSNKIVDRNINKIKSNNVESRFKSKYERDKKVKEVKLSKLVDVKNSKSTIQKNISQNSSGEYDKYYSNINNLILTRWYRYSLLSNTEYLVIVNITIDTQGKFSYHVVKFSGVSNVDRTIKSFLENERLKTYPIPPDKKSKKIQLNFKPDINN